jgi:hypothetical protein
MRTETLILCACGVLFVPNGPRQTRCNACRFSAARTASKTHRYCIRCGQLFTPHGSRDVYCSDVCHRLAPAPLKPCLHCGILFPPQRNQRYCLDCRPFATARARKRLHLPDRVCPGCGKTFTPRRYAHAVCSAACKQRVWNAKHQAARPPKVATPTAEQERRAKLARVLRKHGL